MKILDRMLIDFLELASFIIDEKAVAPLYMT